LPFLKALWVIERIIRDTILFNRSRNDRTKIHS
jgi:hypothetical protein